MCEELSVESNGNKWFWRGALAVVALAGLLAVAITRCEPERPAPFSATPAGTGSAEQIGPWEPIFVGVEMCRASTTRPRPMQIRAVRVDCREATIDFLVTPSNGGTRKDCNARTCSEFLQEFKCQVAINGSVFFPEAKQAGEPLNVNGLSLSRGDLYSQPNQNDALLISKDRKAWIAKSPVKVGKAYNGLSGFHAVLIDGRNVGKDDNADPRSAVGVSKDQRYVILMTIDGRQTHLQRGGQDRRDRRMAPQVGG